MSILYIWSGKILVNCLVIGVVLICGHVPLSMDIMIQFYLANGYQLPKFAKFPPPEITNYSCTCPHTLGCNGVVACWGIEEI